MKALIEELKRERVALYPKKNINGRTVDLENKMVESGQYSHRECVELIGLTEDTHGEELENSAVQAFEISGVNVDKRDFHVIHRSGNSKIVIAKLVNRREAIKILRNKRNSVNLLAIENKILEQRKFMLTSSCVPIIKGYLASATRYSKRSKLNHFTLLTVR